MMRIWNAWPPWTEMKSMTGIDFLILTLTAGTDYEAKSGSTVITLKSSVLEKLAAGDHTVSVNFDDGKVSTIIKVANSTESSNTTGNINAGKNASISSIAKISAGVRGSKNTIPSTGDNSYMPIWFILMCASMVILLKVIRSSRCARNDRSR